MKIYIHRTPTIMDGLVLRWNPWPHARLAPEISASREMVAVYGPWELRSPEAIAEFNVALMEARAAYDILRQGGVPGRFQAREVDVRLGENLDDALARLGVA